MMEEFEARLSGGHPNSLGNTEQVVDIILKDKSRLPDIFETYNSGDEVVRLRVSSAIKRITKAKPEWLDSWMDHMLEVVSKIDQPSTKWTQAQIFLLLEKRLSATQKELATSILKRNLEEDPDWIVQNMTIETLGQWALKDKKLADWLIPRLIVRTKETRNSIVNKAEKTLAKLSS